MRGLPGALASSLERGRKILDSFRRAKSAPDLAKLSSSTDLPKTKAFLGRRSELRDVVKGLYDRYARDAKALETLGYKSDHLIPENDDFENLILGLHSENDIKNLNSQISQYGAAVDKLLESDVSNENIQLFNERLKMTLEDLHSSKANSSSKKLSDLIFEYYKLQSSVVKECVNLAEKLYGVVNARLIAPEGKEAQEKAKTRSREAKKELCNGIYEYGLGAAKKSFDKDQQKLGEFRQSLIGKSVERLGGLKEEVESSNGHKYLGNNHFEEMALTTYPHYEKLALIDDQRSALIAAQKTLSRFFKSVIKKSP
ncbi:MAG: hypothetical protein AAF621_03775 [Pseudomonadota bacterium]